VDTSKVNLEGAEVDLAEIDKIFDQIESEEKRSMLSIMMYLHNIGMVAVIGLSGYIFSQLQGMGSKGSRND
jgi:hypothetical protein